MKEMIKPDPSWSGRRRVIRLSLFACLGLALYSMYLGAPMAAVVFPNVSLLAGAIIGSYVFGAAWERTSGIASQTEVYQVDEGISKNA